VDEASQAALARQVPPLHQQKAGRSRFSLAMRDSRVILMVEEELARPLPAALWLAKIKACRLRVRLSDSPASPLSESLNEHLLCSESHINCAEHQPDAPLT
jgi:hypothetical protein